MQTYSYEDVRKMKGGTKTYDVFEFPFIPEIKIAVRVLTQVEILECLDAGRNDAVVNLSRPREIDAYQYGLIRLLLKSVHKVPEDGNKLSEPFFAKYEDITELSKDEVEKLVEFYESVQEKYSPVQKVETPEDFQKLVEEVKKNKTFGNSLSSQMLRKLVSYLIESSEISPTDNGSGSTL